MLLQTITTLMIVGSTFKVDVGLCSLQISPYPRAYATVNGPVTLTCSYTGTEMFNLIIWTLNNAWGYGFYNCTLFSQPDGYPYAGVYHHVCLSTTKFNWTILKATNEQHGDTWMCDINDIRNTESLHVSLFVIVPLQYISFNSPGISRVSVIEQVSTPFKCETSVERPRSTIQWYIKNRRGSLGTGTTEPSNNDLLSSTFSTLRYNFSRADNGSRIYCTANNTADSAALMSSEKEINVHFPPETPRIKVGIQQIFGPVSVIKGDNVNATCESTSEPGPPSYQWSGQAATGSLLPISNIQTSTTRTCTAKNTMSPSIPGGSVEGSSSASFIINVLTAPTTPKLIYISQSGTRNMMQGSHLSVIKGAVFSVECSGSTSNPSPHNYSWTGNKVSHTNTISFSMVVTNDVGQYTCHVENTMVRTFGATETGKNSRALDISVLFPPETPRIKVGTQQILDPVSVIKGDNVNATCKSTSEPGPPSYQWSGQAATGSLLTISNIQMSTTRTCTAMNTMSPSIPGGSVEGSSSVSFKIDVLTAPTTPKLIYISQSGTRFMLQGSELAVIKGAAFSVECSGSTSNPNPHNYSWTGNKVSHTNTISFSTADTNDAGQYICHVENKMVRTFGATETGKNSRAFNISVLYKPAIHPLMGRTVTENSLLSVTCTATGNPEPTDFKWTRSKDSFEKQTSTLIINSTSREDTDIYNCTAKNRMIQTFGDEQVGEDSASMSVNISYHPDVNVSSLNGTYVTAGGDNVVLQCSAEGDPEAKISRWIHFAPDGNTKVQEYNSTSFVDGKAYLILNKTSYMDSGFYQCHAENGIPDYITGKIEATNMTEQVLGAKPVVVDSVTDISSATQDNASLWIRYYSNNKVINVTWYRIKNGTKQIVSKNDSKFMIENSNLAVNVTFYNVRVVQPGNITLLLIQNVDDNDFGMYDAEITNSINTTVRRIHLVPQGPPDMPIQFTVIQGSVAPTSVLLSWISGFHGGADQTFYIQFKSLTSAWQNKTSVDGFQKKDTVFNVTADELIPATQYSFRLFSANKFNRSEFSAVVNVTTKAEERQNEDASLIGPGIGGGVGAALLIVALVALIIFLRRRNLTGRSTGQKSLLNENSRQKEAMNDDLAEVQNPMYESAGPSANSSTNTDVYAKVDKTKKQDYLTSDSKGDVYSQVQKLHKSGTATIGNEKEQTTDLYAMPVKAKVNHVHQKKEKKQKQEKKDKPGKKKGRLHGHVNEAMVYENSEEFRTRATDSDNAYELTCAGPQLPSRTKNPDGLIYVEVDLPRRNDKKDNTPIVIHGIDDRNDYAEIAFGKVGTPAPDSDDEQKSNDDAKETETV